MRVFKKYSKAGYGKVPRKYVNKEGSYYDTAHWLISDEKHQPRSFTNKLSGKGGVFYTKEGKIRRAPKW